LTHVTVAPTGIVRVAGPNVACATVTCGAVAAAVVTSAWVGDGVAWAAMVPGTLTSQVRRRPAVRAEPQPSLWRRHGLCEAARLVHECSAPPGTSVVAWGRLAARPLRRCSSGVPRGTQMMESDSWLDQCASRDLTRVLLPLPTCVFGSGPAPLLGRDGKSSERACDAALPPRMAGDGVQHSRETPEGAGVMDLRFVLLYRGAEVNVPGPSAHSAVGNKKG
jgi:hypothetical protein